MTAEQGPFRRPKKSKRLGFAEPRPGYLAFAWAYLESARVLSNHFEDEIETNFAAPTVFLFRHSLEMHLKGYLIEFGSNVGISKTEVLSRSHGLIQHLEDIRKLAANVGHDLSKELEEYVTYMHQFDPTAQDWRYPETKTKAGMQSSKGSIEIDIKHFIEASNRVFDELEDIGWDLSSRENARMMEELGINFSDTE
jgi:hypothetical protein